MEHRLIGISFSKIKIFFSSAGWPVLEPIHTPLNYVSEVVSNGVGVGRGGFKADGE
jgi:hypothetical protein